MDEGLRVLLAARLSAKRRKRKDGRPDGNRDGIGIETQDERAREWAQREGMTVVATVADTKSGTVAPWDRKKLKPWVTDPAKLAQYDAVLAYSMDRLSRGTQADLTRIEQWALDNGKVLIVIEEDTRYPSRTDGERAEWDAAKRSARKELEKIRERNDRMQRAIHARGGFVGAPPWGYVITGEEYEKKIEATPEARRLVPEAFRMLLDDRASTVDIAKWLADETGEDWHYQTVAAMIRNRAYTGHRTRTMPARDGRPAQTFDVACEELVDAETWQRAVNELKSRGTRTGRGAAPRALLSSVARCARCAAKGIDSPMYRIRSGNGKLYYRCSGRGRVKAKKGCGNMVPAPVAESLMNQFMGSNRREVLTLHQVRPTNYDVLVREAKLTRKNLDDDAPDYDERYAEATAEVKRLEAERDAHLGERPVTEAVSTGMTYAGKWAGLDESARGDWLRKSGVLAYFAKYEPGAEPVVPVKVSASNLVWAEVRRDPVTGTAMAITWDPDDF